MITTRLPQPPGFGWNPGMGRKWASFRAGDVLVTPPSAPDIRYWNASGWWGDQGQTSECTIYSWLHVMHDGPITHRGTKPMDSTTRLYQLGQDRDGTPRSDVDSGLTSDAAARTMRDEGYIGEYRWARDLDEVVECIRVAGPGTLGSWWPEGMDNPDPLTGFVTYTGRMRGGHQYKVDGVNTRRRFFRFKNSWGRSWGKKGFGYMTFETMRLVLAGGGEFCIARELLNRTVRT